MSQQGLHFSKKISKIKIFFDLTFTDVHTGRQKVPKSDFQSHFPMSKNIRIFIKKNSLKNINLGPHFLYNTFLITSKLNDFCS